MEASYHLAIFGNPPEGFVEAFTECLSQQLAVLSLTLGQEVSWYVGAADQFVSHESQCSAALCFPISADQDRAIAQLMRAGMPIIPVASALERLAEEFREPLSILNGLGLDKADISYAVNCILECASLLPRQRRVFLSYRRSEATQVALQLYAALSERLFDVFLDTHEILPGEHFQEVLWQKLCDSDVMVYLDTESYFSSRWTTAEFGRASFRGIPIQRVGWPGVSLDTRSQISADLHLNAEDFATATGALTEEALTDLCRSIERLRAEGVATRLNQLIDALSFSLSRSKAKIAGYSLKRSVTVRRANGDIISVYPALGVPTTYTLHDATLDNHAPPVAVVYDDVGIDEKRWVSHMTWIGDFLKKEVRLIAPYSAGWHFEDWR